MNNMTDSGIKHLEGRSFIIGREGHIYIDSPLASKQHAELTITNGQVYLRDLKSSNGTYLIRNKKLKQFKEGYVSLLQPVIIGNQKYIVKDFVGIADSYAKVEDSTTELEYVDLNSIKKTQVN